MTNFTWNLAEDSFSLIDKLKICSFILKGNQLTMGPKVKEFEDKISEMAGSYAVATSSGSTANELVFELYKLLHPERFKNTLVIVPAVTWVSSISPAIMAGYQIKFCDINLNDFCFDYGELEEIIKEYISYNKNIIIWATALIGFVPDLQKLGEIRKKYKNVEIFCDCAENTLGSYNGNNILGCFDITTTSCYWSHNIVSIEGGFVFFKDKNLYENALMFRNHGMSRSLPLDNELRLKIEKNNPDIDKLFLFALNGTNLRTTDLNAAFGLLDFKRKNKYIQHRREIYQYYYEKLNSNYYLPPLKDNLRVHVPFCLPVITYKQNQIQKIKEKLNKNGIATRPIIGSNLLLQPPFKKYKAIVPNAEIIHNKGAYVGLHYKITKKKIDFLVDILNNIV